MATAPFTADGSISRHRPLAAAAFVAGVAAAAATVVAAAAPTTWSVLLALIPLAMMVACMAMMATMAGSMSAGRSWWCDVGIPSHALIPRREPRDSSGETQA